MLSLSADKQLEDIPGRIQLYFATPESVKAVLNVVPETTGRPLHFLDIRKRPQAIFNTNPEYTGSVTLQLAGYTLDSLAKYPPFKVWYGDKKSKHSGNSSSAAITDHWWFWLALSLGIVALLAVVLVLYMRLRRKQNRSSRGRSLFVHRESLQFD